MVTVYVSFGSSKPVVEDAEATANPNILQFCIDRLVVNSFEIKRSA